MTFLFECIQHYKMNDLIASKEHALFFQTYCLSLIYFVNLRSCNTLQQALELVQKQHPFEGKAKEADEVSQSTTIPSLGFETVCGHRNLKVTPPRHFLPLCRHELAMTQSVKFLKCLLAMVVLIYILFIFLGFLIHFR